MKSNRDETTTALLEREKPSDNRVGARREPASEQEEAHEARPKQEDTEAESAPQVEDKEDAKSNKRSWIKPLAIGGALIALIAGSVWGVNYWRFASTHTATDDAYLTASVVQVTPQVAGNIAQILVDDNQPVKAGQLIATLDDATYRAAVDQAKAALAVAEANAQGAETTVGLTAQTSSAQIESATGTVAQAQSGIGSAEADVARANAGVANARAGAQTAQANVQTAEAAIQAALAARKRAVAGVGGAQAQVATARAALKATQANVTSAQANLTRASKDEERYQALFRQDAVSAQQRDVAVATAAAARAQLESANQQVAQAQSGVEQKRADLESAQEAVRAADAAIAQARAQRTAAQDSAQAAQAVIRQEQAQVAAAKQGVEQAKAKRAQAVGQLNQARTAPRQVAVSRANRLTAAARVQEAKAALETAEINLRRTRILAPTDGIISKKTVDVGQQVAVGQALMAIVPKDDIWVSANFKETQMRDITAGQKVEIEVDTFPGHHFTGKVDSIAAGTGATFSLLPPDNATGNFTKVVQRVPVKITFLPGQPDLDRLRSGLSAVVTIATK